MAEEEKKKKKRKKKKNKPPKITWWDRIVQFQGILGVAAAILASVVYFHGFIKLDTDPFKQTDLTVAVAQGQMFIEWDLGDTPNVPTEIIYFIDGIQFAHESYPQGLREAVGVRRRYISSYILPPVAYANPGHHDFRAVVVFNGWSTFFTPETVTFSTTFEQDTRGADNNSNFNIPFGTFDDREWIV